MNNYNLNRLKIIAGALAVGFDIKEEEAFNLSEELKRIIESEESSSIVNNELFNRLKVLGIIPNETRDHNIGTSDYSTKTIQPWSVWLDWKLDPWDADIIKRIARHKKGDSRVLDYKKIIHICEEKIRQLEYQDGSKNSTEYQDT